MKKISKAILSVAAAGFLAGTMMTTPADAGPRRRAVQNYEEQEEIGAALGGLALGAAAGAIASEQYYNDGWGYNYGPGYGYGYGYDYGYGPGYGYDYW